MRRTRLASCAVIASQRRRGQPGLAARRTSSRKAKERNGKEVARELKQNMRRSKKTYIYARHVNLNAPCATCLMATQRHGPARSSSAQLEVPPQKSGTEEAGGVLMKASSEATDEDDRQAGGGDWRCQNRGQEGGGAQLGPSRSRPPPPGERRKNLPNFCVQPHVERVREN